MLRGRSLRYRGICAQFGYKRHFYVLHRVSGMVWLWFSRYAHTLKLSGYRQHRAVVRDNGLKSFLGRSQVSRALTVLIESGAFYSVIWVRISELRGNLKQVES